MGIPYYFYTLTKSYDDIISSKLSQVVDVYFLDFNGVIHPICHHLIDTNGVTEDFEKVLIEKLYTKVEEDIKVMHPKKVYICVDGLVPVAKMIQQRKRRYLTAYKNKIDNVNVLWDTNAITPGTSFMNKLNIYFKKQIRYNSTLADIFYSGSDEFGEGEHKIFKLLQGVKQESVVVINGMDADLIILALMSKKNNIYLLREGRPNEDCIYLCIDNLRKAIINELKIKWVLFDDVNEYDIIESYCVMCSLLGNDFIPHLLTFNLKTNGVLDKLSRFTGLAYKTCGLLVHNSTINHLALADILQNIAKTEDTDIHTETEKYIKNRVFTTHESLNSDYYAIKHKQPVAEAIYSNISKWRQIYYRELFYTNIQIDTSVVHQACQQYIKGIYWTYAYYKKKDVDLEWYYPYTYPPSIRDIANYAIANVEPDITNKNQLPLNVNIQTLIVLPIESKVLLDKKHQEFMINPENDLMHLYPKKYIIHTFLKTHLWECSPELPVINIKYVKQIYIK